jgi:hypothetical protein
MKRLAILAAVLLTTSASADPILYQCGNKTVEYWWNGSTDQYGFEEWIPMPHFAKGFVGNHPLPKHHFRTARKGLLCYRGKLCK